MLVVSENECNYLPPPKIWHVDQWILSTQHVLLEHKINQKSNLQINLSSNRSVEQTKKLENREVSSRLTLNIGKPNTEQLILQFSICKIRSMPHTRFLIPRMLLYCQTAMNWNSRHIHQNTTTTIITIMYLNPITNSILKKNPKLIKKNIWSLQNIPS